MQAIILAGGLGTRIGNLTGKTQKVMLPIGGKPLLQWHIEWLKREGIKDMIICSGYKAGQIEDYFAGGNEFGVSIKYSREEEALGTAGAVKNAEKFIDGTFLVYNGDNLTNTALKPLVDFHKRRKPLATVMLYREQNTAEKGMVEIDNEGRIVLFVEKPKKEDAKPGLANAGIYIMEKEILHLLPKGKSDLAGDILPMLLKERKAVYGFGMENAYFIDIGSYKNYEKACRDAEEGII